MCFCCASAAFLTHPETGVPGLRHQTPVPEIHGVGLRAHHLLPVRPGLCGFIPGQVCAGDPGLRQRHPGESHQHQYTPPTPPPQPWWRCVFCQNRHEMLKTDLLAQLLETKWKKFAGQMFCLNFLFYLAYLLVFTAVAYYKREGQVGEPAAPLPVDDAPVVSSPVFLYFLPQWTYKIEHTFWGYLYISGQLLTALANCYFFIIGVHHFHLFKIRALMSHGRCVIYPKKWILICRLSTWGGNVRSCRRCWLMATTRSFCECSTSDFYFLGHRLLCFSDFSNFDILLQKWRHVNFLLSDVKYTFQLSSLSFCLLRRAAFLVLLPVATIEPVMVGGGGGLVTALLWLASFRAPSSWSQPACTWRGGRSIWASWWCVSPSAGSTCSTSPGGTNTWASTASWSRRSDLRRRSSIMVDSTSLLLSLVFWQMILIDILRFLFVYVVFLLGFSAGMEESVNFIKRLLHFG